MIEKLKLILENAMKEEEFFYQYYRDLAEKTTDESVKQALLKLSEAEKIHKEKLEKFSPVGMTDKIDKIQISEELSLKPISEFKNKIDMLDFAIKQEVSARMLYDKLADATDDLRSKELFEMLAEEEAKHEQILTEQMNTIKLGGVF